MKLTSGRIARFAFWLYVLFFVAELAYGLSTGEESWVLSLLGTLSFWCMLFPLFYDWMRRRTQTEDRALFLAEMADLLDMGLDFSECLGKIVEIRRRNLRHRFSDFTHQLVEVRQKLERGDGVFMAFSEVKGIPAHWPSLFSRSEEKDGLVEVLRELSEGERARIRLPVLSALRFLILLVLLFGIVFFLASYILPTYTELMIGSNIAAPWTTQFIVGTRSSPLLFVLAPLSSLFVLALVLSIPYPSIRKGLWRLAYYLPYFRGMIRLQNQAQVFKTLAACIENRATVEEALSYAIRGAQSSVYRKALMEVSNGSGSSLSERFRDFPKLFREEWVWLVEQGERSESLGPCFSTAGDLAERALQQAQAKFASDLDTLIILGIGALAGIAALGVMEPYALILESMLP